MNLTLKQKAFVQTVAMVFGSIVCAAVINFIISNVSTEVILNAFAIGFLSIAVYTFYSIALSRLEYNESLKELKKTFEEK